LPLPAAPRKCKIQTCCSKIICVGCLYADSGMRLCPFCRHPEPETDAEIDILLMKRVMTNEPSALFQVGTLRDDEEDYKCAFLNIIQRQPNWGV
jgi:hypothetical protein